MILVQYLWLYHGVMCYKYVLGNFAGMANNDRVFIGAARPRPQDKI